MAALLARLLEVASGESYPLFENFVKRFRL
jgi:hypothetical protein